MRLSRAFIIFCLAVAGGGFAALQLTFFLEREKALTPQGAKENALRQALKDSPETPLIGSDEFRQYVLANEQGYQIIYQKRGDFFLISIYDSPFNEVRAKAENHFLSLTQAKPQIACQLKVEIVASGSANPELAGQTFPLSFCNE